MRYAVALGLTPSAVLHNEFVENQVFDIANTWVPLSSSYTQSSRQDEGGRPKVDEDNLSPEGEKTRERGDNDPDNRDY